MKVSTRRSGFTIMRSLIVLVKPLTFVMILGILLGVLGFLCAIFLTITGGYGIIKGLYTIGNISISGNIAILDSLFSGNLFAALILMAVARGILHYGEQYCNHYIAFRILAIIRHKVFAVLRKLCPAKLEGKEKGNLIAIITGDIELLEVFFAHTISPIAIAFITSLIMVIFIGMQHPIAGLISLFGYLTVGIALSLWNGSKIADAGMNFRNNVGELNNFVINSMYGVDEILQYNQGSMRLNEMNDRSLKLSDNQKKLSIFEGSQRSATNLVIQLFSWVMFFSMLVLYRSGSINFSQILIATLAMMSSFGPTVALSSLSNNLNQTLACGERVLSLLEEEPAVYEVSGEESIQFNGAKLEDVKFSYDSEIILDNLSLDIKKGKVLGIHGVSGSGKSTLLKLLMRFWDVNTGKIFISEKNIKNINTDNLREMTGYVTQDTVMFKGSIADNIRVAKQNAGMEEIQNAARKASIHDFITSLPKGYETNVGELGDSLSDGEKQRIGLARAFLHDGDFLLLDEPTSNLDVLNEGIILKSLSKESSGKTIVLVSHRKSTMSLADEVYKMSNGRFS
ncbi:ABC transporter ATP-binding protein [Lachnoanaerobaculum sp. Marseille-Q4761]|uniref:amino acid ABC transporter ATP-binding/permease protein n=1 Tax=Lachnoanaerobaculum sp. Marseille-Q4761 TaxID=2819511 RepID=UPI001AA0BFF9|nr:ABC transporter ATP-binding protein [Lachnoanaerobaculum sp. Marseille-Q4761]MBO1872061.1 ABC transporter ATP-binding protein [Lachnoanaerobaculum sp. Marseille-Q4761]